MATCARSSSGPSCKAPRRPGPRAVAARDRRRGSADPHHPWREGPRVPDHHPVRHDHPTRQRTPRGEPGLERGRLTRGQVAQGHRHRQPRAALRSRAQMDQHEKLRLLYVAATRRDHLIVSAHHKVGTPKPTYAGRIWNYFVDAPDLWQSSTSRPPNSCGCSSRPSGARQCPPTTSGAPGSATGTSSCAARGSAAGRVGHRGGPQRRRRDIRRR